MIEWTVHREFGKRENTGKPIGTGLVVHGAGMDKRGFVAIEIFGSMKLGEYEVGPEQFASCAAGYHAATALSRCQSIRLVKRTNGCSRLVCSPNGCRNNSLLAATDVFGPVQISSEFAG
ncbi:hypothetical protein [Ralstonia soli]|uniref:Uncharacterized protein n=1 Tax=Ralstonia soli TaxID=2953896 RepID=A0ABT1AEH0_9RALS|nr:hypothetical protein [Ralstonia soli]MCO5396708.1 hypothetical protein [Ralstonia soli]